MAMTKIKGLQMWCRKMTEGYAHVDIANFTTAWRDGMAFCAIIHRFRPDLIDYDSLSPDNVYENCKLAFEVAERDLDIPAFLEAEDMARLKVPDKLSVITYVSQYYNFLNSLPQLGGPGVKGKVSSKNTAASKRPANIDTSQAPSTKKPATDKSGKENVSLNIAKAGDKCGICHEHVYLLERHIEDGKLYHRSCYRHSELSPTNKVYTRSPFLSPSLSSKTPPPRPVSPSPHHTTTSTDSHTNRLTPVSHHHTQAGLGAGGSNVGPVASSNRHTPFTTNVRGSDTTTAAREGLRHQPLPGERGAATAGVKHSLAEKDREDTKKSKVEQVDDSKHAKTKAIKDRLQNLKDKYEVAKETNGSSSAAPSKSAIKSSALQEKQSHSNVLPFSGKEARKFEIKRDLAAEEQAEKLPRGGKRNMPLIFQQKTEDNGPQSGQTVSVLSNAKVISSSSAALTPQLPTSSISSLQPIFSTPTSSKTTDSTSKPVKKTALKVVKATSPQTAFSNKPAPDTLHEDSSINSRKQDTKPVKQNEVPDIKSLQKRFSTPEVPVTFTEPLRPVAKTRTQKPSESDREQTPTPKAAPRKSHNLQSEIELKTGRGHFSNPTSPRDVAQPTSDRSTGSGSPPPLPKSPPPPLPSSPIPSSVTVTINSSSSHPSTQAAGSKLPQSSPPSTVIMHLSSKPSDKEEVVSMYGPVKSKVSSSSAATASLSSGPNRSKRWSSPNIQDAPLSVFATPTQATNDPQEKQLISGLLVSLAGVRGRAGSVPGVTDLATLEKDSTSSVITPAKPSSSVVSTAPHSSSQAKTPVAPISGHRKHSEPIVSTTKLSLLPNQDGGKDKDKRALGISNNTKTVNGPLVEPVPEALSVLKSLKKAEEPKSNCPDAQTDKKKWQHKKDETVPHQRESPRQTTAKQTIDNNKMSEQNSSKVPFTAVKLKHVSPEPVHTPETSSVPAFDVHLKRVDNVDKQPPSSVGMSSGEHSSSRDIPGVGLKHSPRDNKAASSQPASSQTEAKLSSNKKSKMFEEDELPDWKTALEDRKKKLKHEAAARSGTNLSKTELPSTNKPVSESLTTGAREKNNNQAKNVELKPSLSPSHESKLASDKTGPANVTSKEDVAIAPIGKEVRSPDWKRTAEMNFAALGGFDSDDDSKKSARVARKLPPTPTSISGLDQTKQLEVKKTAVKVENNKSEVNIKRKNEANTSEEQSKPEFLTGKSRLKHVSVDADKQEQQVKDSSNHKSKHDTVRTDQEDFREKLHKLKHVQGAGEGTQEKPVSLTHDKKQSKLHLTKPLPLLDSTRNNMGDTSVTIIINNNTKNTNNNSVADNTDKGQIILSPPSDQTNLLLESINLASSPDVSDDTEADNDNKRSQQKTSTPILQNGKSSPKPKKKIKLFGKGKKSSPKESPIHAKKKIEVPVQFDFDKSTDLESSLVDQTSTLSLAEDMELNMKKTPPRAHISAIELQQQLLDIDSRLTDLELRGRDLEDSIRNASVNALEEEEDDSLMIKWFELVSEKNDLVRQEADLVYITREQDLESEQEHIESQLRYLISKPDANKSSAEMEEEEYLIQRKIELVEQRNRIVDSMDEDRLRYEEEDRDIEVTLRGKGLWKDSNGTLIAMKGKKVARSTFFT